MIKSDEFLQPLKWNETDVEAYDGVWLGGEHAKDVREYLDSKVLQKKLGVYIPKTKGSEDSTVLAAICHRPVLLARTVDETRKSVGWS